MLLRPQTTVSNTCLLQWLFRHCLINKIRKLSCYCYLIFVLKVFTFQVWYKELGKIKPEQKLPMMYLANDLVQNSRKKHPEVSKEFGTVMKATFAHLAASNFDLKTQKSLNRLISIWKERQTFDKKVLSDIDEAWDKRSNKYDADQTQTDPSPLKKMKIENKDDQSANIDMDKTSDSILKLLDLLKSTDDLDTSEELLSSLPDLSNISQLELSPDETKEKCNQVEEAENQLIEQNKILENEIQTRNYLDQLMSNYILSQRKLITKKKERLKNCKRKLQSVEEAKLHFESQLLDAALVDDELDAIPMPDSLDAKPKSDSLDAIPMPDPK